jgi:hypothetical protein
MVERKFTIAENTERPPPARMIAESHIPNFHRIFQGYEKFLLSFDPRIIALVFDIRKSVPAGITGRPVFRAIGKRLTYRLPGEAPVLPGIIIPYIDIVAGPVQGDPVRPKPGYPVKFRGLVKKIAPGVLTENPAHILEAYIISPGNRRIRPFYNVFPVWLVKIAVLHDYTQ